MICQVAEMFNDKNKISADLNEAVETIKNMFYKKYFEPIINVMEKEQKELDLHEPKEIKLLKALEPFLNPNEKILVNKITRCITATKIINKFNTQIKITAQQNNSEHSDGIYDLDQDCLAKKNNNLMTMALIFALSGMY